MVEIDEVVVNKARANGADGWLADLPALIASLERDWSIGVGRALGGGTEAWVGEAIGDDGEPVVLKLCVPRAADDRWVAARQEAAVLEAVGGRGCARLHRSDPHRGALLVERLGPAMVDVGVRPAERLAVLADLAAQLWRPPAELGPSSSIHRVDLLRGDDKATALADSIVRLWVELDRPCSEAAVEEALAAADRRRAAHDDVRAVLVHGDVHQWNALRTTDGTGWKLIDPDGLVAEPEYDLGVLLREDPEELRADVEAGDPRRRARWLADRTGTDADAIWDWGLVERVSTGLLATRIDLQPIGGEMLAVADRLAG